MKAVLLQRHGGPEVLEVVDVATPTPAAGEVLVQARAFGVGLPDALMRRGDYPWRPPPPFNPGNTLAGEVVALGAGVGAGRLGERVLVSSRDLSCRGGCYAEFIAAPAGAVQPLPDGVGYDEAVCLPNYAVAWSILAETAGPRPPRTALIVGAAGGVGSALVQLAKRAGLCVIALVSTPERAAFALSLGADHVVDRRNESLAERTMALTAGAGVDLIVDNVAGAPFLQYPGLLAYWGTLVSYAALAGDPGPDLFRVLRAHVEKSPSIRFFSMHSYDDDSVARRRTSEQVLQLFARGELKPAIAGRFRLEDVRDAHHVLDAGSALGRIVMHT